MRHTHEAPPGWLAGRPFPRQPVTVAEAISWTAETRWRRKADVIRSVERARKFAELGGLGSRRLDRPQDAVTSADFERAAQSLEAAGAAASTVNRYAACLRSALNAVHLEGLSSWPPPRWRSRPDSGGRTRYPSRKEVALVLRALRAHRSSAGPLGARFTRLLWRSGMRVGEALRVTRQDVMHIGEGQVGMTLKKTKNGRPRVVPIPPACNAMIRLRYETRQRPDAPLWPLNQDTFSRLFRDARKAAGLGSWCVPHTLRHARATQLIRASVPIPVVSEILGHATWKTTAKYTHPQLSDLAAAIRAR